MEKQRNDYLEILLKKKCKLRENSWLNEDDSTN